MSKADAIASSVAVTQKSAAFGAGRWIAQLDPHLIYAARVAVCDDQACAVTTDERRSRASEPPSSQRSNADVLAELLSSAHLRRAKKKRPRSVRDRLSWLSNQCVG